MTRQKKEILKKIDWLEGMIQADIELGCGYNRPDSHRDTEEEIYGLQVMLAKLSHYDSVESLIGDERWMKALCG